MNGTRYFLDTNAIITLLNGSKTVEDIISRANWLGISVISIIEFNSFSQLSNLNKEVFRIFLQRVVIINLIYSEANPLTERIAKVRSDYRIKLPDAIIAASAQHYNATLITNDLHFKKISSLQTLQF
ncbi:MAG: PIN domain-containing protein [Ilyomonas sp.]